MTAMRSSLSLLQTWYSISTKSHIVDRTTETFLLQGVCTYFSRHHTLRLYTLLSACLLVVCNLLKASESKLYPCDCRSRVEFFPPLKSVQNLSLFHFLSGSRNMQGRLQPTLFLLHQTCPPESQLSVKDISLYLLSLQGILYTEWICSVQYFSWHFHLHTVHSLSFKSLIAGLWSRQEPVRFWLRLMPNISDQISSRSPLQSHPFFDSLIRTIFCSAD